MTAAKVVPCVVVHEDVARIQTEQPDASLIDSLGDVVERCTLNIIEAILINSTS